MPVEPFAGSPAAAYRADMAGRDGPFGPDDDQWLVAASELHLAATASSTGAAPAAGATEATNQRPLFDALGVAIDLLGEERIEAMADREWQGERSHVEALMVLCEVMLQAGALHLAGMMLDDLQLATPDRLPVQRGRILTMRARVDWKLGRLDQAVERYESLLESAKRAKSPELVARAEVGLGAIAQLRGNYPEMRSRMGRAAKIADELALTSIARRAHHGLMIASARDARYDDALLDGRKVFDLSLGDAVFEAESLQNLGQLLLEAGHPDSARACFAAVVDRAAPSRILLPALGGLALAAAQQHMEAIVELAVREVWRAQRIAVPRYELANALLECATALAGLRRFDEASRYQKAANAIAVSGGFHELVYRAEHLDASRSTPGAERVPLQASAARVARDLSELEPERLPAHVSFDAASA